MKDSFEFTASQRTKYDCSTAAYSASPREFSERELWSRRVAVAGDFEKEMQVAMFAKADEVSLRLTDAEDPLFLFVWELEARAYPLFRAEQQLRVEFPQFASKLAQLLDLAAGRRGGAEAAVSFAIKIARKEPGRLMLRVCESNDFKELDHLALPFCAAGDERLKRFLASRVREIGGELSAAQAAGDGLRARLEAALADRAELRLALDQVDAARQSAEEALRRDAAARLEQERSAFDGERLRWEAKLDQVERAQAEAAAAAARRAREFEDGLAAAAARERELRLRLKEAEGELASALQDLERSRKGLRGQEGQAAQLEADLCAERQRTAKAQQLADRLDSEARELRASLAQANEKGFGLEGSLREKAQLAEKLESKLKLSSAEILKANEIMENFEAELQKKSTKLRDCKAQVLRAEKDVAELKLQNGIMAKQISEMAASLETAGAREAQTVTRQIELEAKIAELQKALEVSQSSVGYLSQKVTEQSRPFMRPSLNDAREHPWAAAPTGLSATAQALLRRTSEAPGPSLRATELGKQSISHTLSVPGASIPDPDSVSPLMADYRLPSMPLNALYDNKRTQSSIDDEEPRNPIAKTILPVKFKSNF